MFNFLLQITYPKITKIGDKKVLQALLGYTVVRVCKGLADFRISQKVIIHIFFIRKSNDLIFFGQKINYSYFFCVQKSFKKFNMARFEPASSCSSHHRSIYIIQYYMPNTNSHPSPQLINEHSGIQYCGNRNVCFRSQGKKSMFNYKQFC